VFFNLNKLQNILAFYRNILATNIAISILTLIFDSKETFLLFFLTFGYIICIAITEINKSENYLFYYNNKLTKIQLIIYGAILNFIVVLIFALVNVLINKML
jgi:hypothetical protein